MKYVIKCFKTNIMPLFCSVKALKFENSAKLNRYIASSNFQNNKL